MKDKFEGWKIGRSVGFDIKSRYLDICEQAVKNSGVFDNFKKNPNYTSIAEHCPHNLAISYFDKMTSEESPLLSFLDLLKEKEKHGNPSVINVGLSVSASTLRYLKVADDLRILFGDTKGFSIVEIGGAYGGQATVIDTVLGFKNYVDIDLAWPAKLAKKYCSLNNVENFSSFSPSKVEEKLTESRYDLAISNYAFSECEEETQDFYIKEVFSRCDRGYITVNGSLERKARVENEMRNFDNFRKFGDDMDKHKHPIFAWGGK
jgi:putative sugar O-methyltransferase